MNEQVNVIAAILHLKQASTCLKLQYPSLSLDILKLANSMINLFNISESDIVSLNELAHTIKTND